LKRGFIHFDDRSSIILENEISCIDSSPISPDSPYSSTFCCVGLWTDNSIRILSLPELIEKNKIDIPGGIFLSF
jgi:DNA damage-binding protein 1